MKKLTVHEALNPVPLLRGFKGHEIHAPFPAVISGVEPTPLSISGSKV